MEKFKNFEKNFKFQRNLESIRQRNQKIEMILGLFKLSQISIEYEWRIWKIFKVIKLQYKH